MRRPVEPSRLLAFVLCGIAAVAGEAPHAEEPQVRKVEDIPETEREFLFLKIGERVDYLKEERGRLIDQIEHAVPPLYEPIRPFHGYTLPPGVWRVALVSTFGRNPGDFGTDDFYSSFFDDVTVDSVTVNLNLLYGFETDRLHDMVLNLEIPAKSQRTSGTGHPFRIDPMQMTMEGAGGGIGDVSVTVKKKWLDQGNGALTFSTMLGAILPTGNDNEEFNTSQTIFIDGAPAMAVSTDLPGNPGIDIFSRHPGERLFPRVGQPGNGSWGVRAGFGLSRQFERSALHAGAVYDLLSDNDGITPGDELKYGASYTFPPTSSDYWTIDLSLFGGWKGDEKFPGTITHPERDPATGGPIMDASGNIVMFTTRRPDFKHGPVAFFSPSVVFIASPSARIFLSPAYRILEPSEGPSPRWTMTFGTTWTF